jgi:hypothetical protein
MRPALYKLGIELSGPAKDCNDMDNNIHSSADELCNGLDDDCDVLIDEDVSVLTWYQDMDGDGYGNPLIVKDSCAMPAGYVFNDNDCNDTSSGITQIQLWYKDLDGDNHTDSIFLYACSRPTVYKLSAELAISTKDCDDSNPAVYPGAIEVCDNLDNNCNGQIDEGFGVTSLVDPMTIYGHNTICPDGGIYSFSIDPVVGATSYIWSYNGTTVSMLGQNTTSLQIDIDVLSTGGTLTVVASNICTTTNSLSMNIGIGSPLLCMLSDCSRESTYIDQALLDGTLTQSYQAQVQVVAEVHLQNINRMQFRAGDNILLNPSFEVDKGVLFEAEIGPCEK